MRSSGPILSVLLAGLAAAAAAGQPEDSSRDYLAKYEACGRHAAAAERLACFDAVLTLYRLEAGLPETERGTATTERARAPGWETFSPDHDAAPRTHEAEAASPSTAPERAARRSGRGSESFTARIVRLWKPHPRGRYHFELDDGTVWRQTSGPWVTITEGETGPVEFFRGAMGGWRMRVEGRTGLSFVAPVE